MPGYYNVSVTIGDIYGTTVPWKPVFEVSQPGYGSDRSVNTYWPSLSGALGVHMLQVCSSCMATHGIIHPSQCVFVLLFEARHHGSGPGWGKQGTRKWYMLPENWREVLQT